MNKRHENKKKRNEKKQRKGKKNLLEKKHGLLTPNNSQLLQAGIKGGSTRSFNK